MKSTIVSMVVALVAQSAWAPAWAASGPSPLRPAPNLAKDAEALPMLVGGTRAIAKINRALAAANARQLREMKDCLRDAPQEGFWWEQAADATLLGARFVSFYRHGNFSCGGAHPNFIMDAFVFDLRTGRKVDWRKLLPPELAGKAGTELASPQLTALFVAASDNDSAPECKEEFKRVDLRFQLWPDAKARGLAMHTSSLPHSVEGVCAGPVTIPLATLKTLGVNAALLRDIETSRPDVRGN